MKLILFHGHLPGGSLLLRTHQHQGILKYLCILPPPYVSGFHIHSFKQRDLPCDVVFRPRRDVRIGMNIVSVHDLLAVPDHIQRSADKHVALFHFIPH